MRELPITGYLNRLSARPGEILTAQVSVSEPQTFKARLVRVISADANPAGPGIQVEDLSAVFSDNISGQHQPTYLGSFGEVVTTPRRREATAITWSILVWTGFLEAPAKALISEAGLLLTTGCDGTVAELSTLKGKVSLTLEKPLRLRTWYRLWISFDPVTGTGVLGQKAVNLQTEADCIVTQTTPMCSLLPCDILRFAASSDKLPDLHFNGRLEDPMLLGGFTYEWQDPFEVPHGLEVLSRWDFALGIDGLDLIDTGPQACHGRLINLPQRAVRGARWSGQEMCWRQAPQDYGAIEFHSDDLNDCGWERSFEFTVPVDLRSGSYAFHISCDGNEDWLWFFILPVRGTRTADVCVLMSTYTYVAYANHARANVDEAHRARLAQWGANPYNPDDYPIYGTSTYNLHPDRSGMAFSTWLRPMLNMRPGFMVFNDPKSSGVRHYVADHHILSWLEAKNIKFDLVTDHDLQVEGVELLKPYKTVLTCTHPEYHTIETLDAIMAYSRTGGRLCYLGGNGFYWRIAISNKVPGTIELRRSEGGIRAWAAEPGEYYHAFDGKYSGLWQRNCRPPQQLAGVGFSAQGAYEATYFRRTTASKASDVSWIFAGVEDDVIGDYGLCAGGAAGFELDRAVPRLGTSPNSVILAVSENLPASFMPVFEEMYGKDTLTGETPIEMMRGEMVYFETAAGGAVFSVGSITFCGSLWREGGWQGAVSQILENVVRRFSA